ncbi:hypothetical protein [Cryptosporangium arvum]|nr:hypothetical protein [Cryptosporangium arvum]
MTRRSIAAKRAAARQHYRGRHRRGGADRQLPIVLTSPQWWLR